VGALVADFIVLDRDPIAAPVDALEDAGVTGPGGAGRGGALARNEALTAV
jgi:hypothetical protein